MTDKFEKTVTYTLLKAEVAEARRAIVGIWTVWFSWTVQGVADVSDFEAAMAEGLSCLPPEYRTPEMPDKIPYRQLEAETELERKVRRRGKRDVSDAVFESVVENKAQVVGEFDDILG
jgi:hypothetical protein